MGFMMFLNPFDATVSFLYPLKLQKTRGFLKFSGGVEIEDWREIIKISSVIQKYFFKIWLTEEFQKIFRVYWMLS